MNAENKKDWNEANQRYLTAALSVLRKELESYKNCKENNNINDNVSSNGLSTTVASITTQEKLEKAAWDLAAPPALESLVAILGLSTFERKILLQCIGVELDTHFSSLIACLQGGPLLVHPSFSLALAAFPDAHWSAIFPRSPLRYWRLIELTNGEILTKSSLKIDEQVLQYVTGVLYLDDRLEEILDLVAADPFVVPSHSALANAMLLACMPQNGHPVFPLLQLSGENSGDKPAIAAFTCAKIGLHLYTLSVSSLPATAKDIRELARLWNREAALNSFALFLDCSKLDVNDKLRVQLILSFIENIQGVLILSTNQWQPDLKRQNIEFEVLKPTSDEQFELWKNALGEYANGLDEPLKGVVSHFNLSAKTIDLASESVLLNLEENKENDTAVLAKKLWKACCVHTRPKVDELAQPIEPVATWNDIVLPEAQKQLLREIAVQVKHRKKVYRDWGFAGMGSRGLGISALFTGESGTGKTMAAEVLANELQLDLYRIDLSQVVNKYIGETEKNLKQIFDAAEEGGAILLFDEADALFGKRSDVKDSHDRYSNIEVSYLLQRMEAYGGLAVLTTNMKSALDKAFLRRIRFLVQFPYPDAVHRAEIWRRVFPANTPVKDLDIEKLSKLSVPGGNIRNIALNAAFIAADEGLPVQMGHISRAVRSEYSKIEKAVSNAETGGW